MVGLKLKIWGCKFGSGLVGRGGVEMGRGVGARLVVVGQNMVMEEGVQERRGCGLVVGMFVYLAYNFEDVVTTSEFVQLPRRPQRTPSL